MKRHGKFYHRKFDLDVFRDNVIPDSSGNLSSGQKSYINDIMQSLRKKEKNDHLKKKRNDERKYKFHNGKGNHGRRRK